MAHTNKNGISSKFKIIGGRIREARIAAGVSQKDAAKELQISPQQLHKLETGTNRTCCLTLYALAQLYSRDVNWFFKELDKKKQNTDTKRRLHKGWVQLFDYFSNIDDRNAQNLVAQLIKILGSREYTQPPKDSIRKHL